MRGSFIGKLNNVVIKRRKLSLKITHLSCCYLTLWNVFGTFWPLKQTVAYYCGIWCFILLHLLPLTYSRLLVKSLWDATEWLECFNIFFHFAFSLLLIFTALNSWNVLWSSVLAITFSTTDSMPLAFPENFVLSNWLTDNTGNNHYEPNDQQTPELLLWTVAVACLWHVLKDFTICTGFVPALCSLS